MNQIILIFIIVILLIITYYYFQNFENFSNSILNEDSSISFIKNFTKEISIYRPNGSKELVNVKNKIINEMKKIGLKTEIQSFTRTINNKDYSFSNLIGKNILKYANKKFILLVVHIDSPQIKGCESTIDAATGISIALELARNIINKNQKYPIMLLFTDGEEALGGKWSKNNTLSGSRYFVNNYNISNIDKVYVFDLIGGDFNKNKIAAFSNNPITYYDIKKLANINKKYDKQIFINPSKYISNRAVDDDHVPFVEKNIYSLNLIPYRFPDSHHTLNDNYDNVNWKYVEIFYKIFLEFLDNSDKIN
jgi:Zn-dependent M28 family amino/carboxypeptidase